METFARAADRATIEATPLEARLDRTTVQAIFAEKDVRMHAITIMKDRYHSMEVHLEQKDHVIREILEIYQSQSPAIAFSSEELAVPIYGVDRLLYMRMKMIVD